MTDRTAPPTPLSAFFQAKSVSAALSTGGHTIEVEVQTPALTTCQTSMWGDWGPMYTCHLEDDHSFDVTYRCPETGQRASYTFRPPKVQVTSPALYAQRQETPLCLEFVDHAHCVGIRAFMDHEGRVSVVEATCVLPGAELHPLIFGSTVHTGVLAMSQAS